MLDLILLLRLLGLLSLFLGVSAWRHHRQNDVRNDQATDISCKKRREKDRELLDGSLRNSDFTESNGNLRLLKEMYFKLNNLEMHEDVLSTAHQFLLELFSEALLKAAQQPQTSILRVSQYDQKGLEDFVRASESATTQQWEDYVTRRRTGRPRELFSDAEQAKWWLEQSAPARFVDGAWLGHINKITTPFNLRPTTKHAWQVLSEELGDGDLNRNHAFLYKQLLEEVGSPLPAGHSRDFVREGYGLNHRGVWKSAVSQLLISLFPHEFLPEILGFNLHFEGLTLSTMQAAHELKELHINPYYFLIHIAIDNSDSGHTAMALQAVVEYIEAIRAQSGDEAVQQVWRRIQAGYVLSSTFPCAPVEQQPLKPPFVWNQLAEQVAKIFEAKAVAADKIHCNSRMFVGSKKLTEWLDPSEFSDTDWQKAFLEALSGCKPWIKRGDGANSKLVRELCWGGKMFGSFTHNEVEIVKTWIDSLDNFNSEFYWDFTKRSRMDCNTGLGCQDITRDYPVFLRDEPAALKSMVIGPGSLGDVFHLEVTASSLPKLLPIWFSHQSLLENFVSVPFRTTDVLHSAVVRLLRCQYGFGIEKDVVDGIDEVRRHDTVGLFGIGLELARACGETEPTSLHDVLARWPSPFCLTLLHASMRPIQYKGMLLGMTNAFVKLHEAVAASGLLSPKTSQALKAIAQREISALEVCVQELRGDEKHYADFNRGQALVQVELIHACEPLSGL
jgi:hypothetical protein